MKFRDARGLGAIKREREREREKKKRETRTNSETDLLVYLRDLTFDKSSALTKRAEEKTDLSSI